MSLHRDPKKRLDRIERQLNRESLDEQVRMEVEKQLPEIYQEFVSLQSTDAFEKHMSKFVSDAYLERQRGERGPLCSCSSAVCPLTNGKLPPQVRSSSDSLMKQKSGRKRVQEFLQKHRGAEVLHEMLEEWSGREGELHREISEIMSQLTIEHDKTLRDLPQT